MDETRDIPARRRIVVGGESVGADDAPRTATLRIEAAGREAAGHEAAEARAEVRFCSTRYATGRLDALRVGLPAIRQGLEAVKARGQDPSYPRVTATVLENFIDYAGEDARHGKVQRALAQVRELEAMAMRVRRELTECLEGRRAFPPVPRWTGSERAVIQGSSFLAPVRWPDGSEARRPVFFTGYGHFGRVVADLEKWPAYGTNIIQIELGPRDIARLNERYGSRFATWEEVPLPDPFGPLPAGPLTMDYVRFNQEFFARRHAMLAEGVHRIVRGQEPVHTRNVLTATADGALMTLKPLETRLLRSERP